MLDTTQLVVNKDNKAFYCDMSDITKGGKSNPFHSVYGDGVDDGFFLMSHITAKVSEWVCTGTRSNGDDILDWCYTPTFETIKKFPNLRNWRVFVMND